MRRLAAVIGGAATAMACMPAPAATSPEHPPPQRWALCLALADSAPASRYTTQRKACGVVEVDSNANRPVALGWAAAGRHTLQLDALLAEGSGTAPSRAWLTIDSSGELHLSLNANSGMAVLSAAPPSSQDSVTEIILVSSHDGSVTLDGIWAGGEVRGVWGQSCWCPTGNGTFVLRPLSHRVR